MTEESKPGAVKIPDRAAAVQSQEAKVFCTSDTKVQHSCLLCSSIRERSDQDWQVKMKIHQRDSSERTIESMPHANTLFNRIVRPIDLLCKETIKTCIPGSSRQIILIRHGKHSMEGGLTEEGEKQALSCGKYLQKCNIHPTRILCSKKVRSLQTAEIISGQFSLTPTSSHLLNEITLNKDHSIAVSYGTE